MKPTLLFLTGLLVSVGPFTAHAANVTFGTVPNQFSIEFVEIGDAGNADDATGNPNPVGKVDYNYQISKYEISEDMVDKTGLGITHDGRGASKPATSITWFEAAKFVNWLNTSSGGNAAYKFDVGGNFQLWTVGDTLDYNASNTYRSLRASYWLPSADEWYKAAFYDPVSDTYSDYATGQNVGDAPTAVTGGTADDTAVYDQSFPTGPADITQAGGLSPFGTMAQSGNAWEWEETANDLTNSSTSEQRGQRGGAWNNDSSSLQSSTRFGESPTSVLANVGFRVAANSVVPEPSGAVLVMVGVCGILMRRRRCLASL